MTCLWDYDLINNVITNKHILFFGKDEGNHYVTVVKLLEIDLGKYLKKK